MEILVTDRESIESGFLVRCGYAVISIRDSQAPRARVPKSSALRAVLHLAFDDAEPTTAMALPPDVRCFSARQARKIWKFVDQQKGHVEALVVHCHQGMSRSPAVAAALAKYFGQDERRFWREYIPNRHVFDLMLATMPKAADRRRSS